MAELTIEDGFNIYKMMKKGTPLAFVRQQYHCSIEDMKDAYNKYVEAKKSSEIDKFKINMKYMEEDAIENKAVNKLTPYMIIETKIFNDKWKNRKVKTI